MAEAILDFWFGALRDDGTVAPAKQELWFKKDPAFDQLVAKRYRETIDLAFMGAFDRWTTTPRGTLAVLLLVDQFPRQIHRGTERAFAYDKKALATAWTAATNGAHLQLPVVMGYFMLMPLMHSEFANVQELAVTSFQQLLAASSAVLKPLIANALRYAERHQEVIARFGRFPHRNAVLRRVSTAEELAFLKEPGSSF